MENNTLTKCIEKKLNSNKGYTIFFEKGCPYCDKALSILRSSNVIYKGYDLSTISGGKDNVLNSLNNISLDKNSKNKIKNHTTKPIIFYKKKFIGGYSELKKYL